MVASGSSIREEMPSQSSPRLWGGMLVAMPTAIPEAPLRSRSGILAGRTTGSLRLPSKFGAKSTVSFSISANISAAIRERRASVYLIAAGGSLSTLPKLPCPSTSVYLMEKS